MCILLLCFPISAWPVSPGDDFPAGPVDWDIVVCSAILSFWMLRFLVIGSQINAKYSDTTVLLTEQINLRPGCLWTSPCPPPCACHASHNCVGVCPYAYHCVCGHVCAQFCACICLFGAPVNVCVCVCSVLCLCLPVRCPC